MEHALFLQYGASLKLFLVLTVGRLMALMRKIGWGWTGSSAVELEANTQDVYASQDDAGVGQGYGD